MLKITRIDTPAEQRLVLEGRLIEPWSADLTSHWEQTRHARPERTFIVDLRGVTRIDGTVESALALMKSEERTSWLVEFGSGTCSRAWRAKAPGRESQNGPKLKCRRRSPAWNVQRTSEASEVRHDAKR